MTRNFLLLAALSMASLQGYTQSKTKTHAAAKPVLKTQIDSVSYAIGQDIGAGLKSQGLDQLNAGLLVKALQDAWKGAPPALTKEQSNMSISNYLQKIKTEKAAKNQADGEKFLSENKAKPGVTTLPSGLQYQVIKEGSGPKPAATDTVKTHYHGMLIDGTVFDSSVERGEPVTFPVSGVIKGWTEALQLMPVGSKWKLFIPAALAYGDRQAGPKIGPNSTLVFEVELLEIVK
jgi:FKBP-type peptidyl-prolyl cis-trans isomerase FklB